ncbi:MAG: hypothetical protein WBL20_08790 [Sphingobium sp.]|uniref:hypothetical protein n=1 Tax=Sphingobium sp. TaxID=1912891 RepID=UPI003BB1923B
MQHDDSAIEADLEECVGRLAGHEALMKLKSVIGGSYIYVPHRANLRADHSLVLVLGFDVAKAVCDELNRTRHYVSLPVNNDRERAVTWATLAGLSRRATAALASCSETYVYRIIALGRNVGRVPVRVYP